MKARIECEKRRNLHKGLAYSCDFLSKLKNSSENCLIQELNLQSEAKRKPCSCPETLTWDGEPGERARRLRPATSSPSPRTNGQVWWG